MNFFKKLGYKFILSGVVFLLIFSSFSCIKKGSNSKDVKNKKSVVIELEDYQGRIVSLAKAEATRVVVMADNALPFVKQVGAISNVIALDSKTKSNLSESILSKTNPELLELPDVGKTSSPNYEYIVSLNPDLIIFKGSKENADVLAEKTGIPVACVTTKEGYDFKVYMFIATFFGRQEGAKSVVKVLEKYKNSLEVSLSDVNKRKSAYFVIQNSKKSLTRSMKNIMSSRLANLANIADNEQVADQYGFVDMSAESFVEKKVDFVFLDLPLNSNSIQKEDVLKSDILKFSDAVKEGKVYYAHSFSLPKDYVYVIAEAYYLAMLAYPEIISEDMCRECIDECFKMAYSIPDYYVEFKKTLQY